MKLKFKHQTYQTHAVQAVVECFKGQPPSSGTVYRVDPGRTNKSGQQDVFEVSGFNNTALALTGTQLLEHIHAIQHRDNLPLSSALAKDEQTGCVVVNLCQNNSNSINR